MTEVPHGSGLKLAMENMVKRFSVATMKMFTMNKNTTKDSDMTTFTASEVRANAAFRRKEEPELAAMLYAFADLLEAQEKAVPAGWAKDFSEQRETIVSWSKDAPEFGKGGWWPLYTHPSADENTKRLQFIEEHPGWLRYSQPHGKHKNGWCCANPLTNYEYEMFATATEAIDAARAKEPQSRKIAEAARICREVEEAREKAVPIYQLMATDDSWWDVSRELYEAEGSHAGRTRILYTHSAPSDAERLAEALRDCIRDLFIAAEYSKTMRNPNALLETANRAEKALAAHSAQAQPSAQSKYAPPYPDQAQDPFWKVPGMVDTRPKAQPPAASVTVDAVMRVIDGQRRLPYCSIDEKQAFRNELEAALAAQENPNGL